MKRTCRRLAALVAGAALSVSAESVARAQQIPPSNGGGLDTHLFRPAMDSKGLFTTNGSDILGANDVSFGLIIDYGRDLLRVDTQGTSESGQLIDHSFQGTLAFNYGLFNQLVIGIDVPVDLMTGEAITTQPDATQWTPSQLNLQTLGFLGLHAKWRITRVEKGIGLAIGAQIGGPVNSNAALSGGADPSFWYWPEAIIEKRFGTTGQFKIKLNAGYRGHNASGTTLALQGGNTYVDGSLFTFNGGVSYRILEPLDLVAETYGTYLLASGATNDVKTSAEAVGGLKLFVEANSFLMIGAGARYTDGFEAANLRGFIGFVFEPSIGDRDGDGIKDDVDKCPDEPEDFDGFQDEDGCPDPDNDNDGILDVDDRCPNEPEDRDGDQDWDGCPEVSDGDRDGDGILDSKDKCPDQPEDRDGFQDEDGCPDPDNDQDGIPDKRDACPNDPEDKDGFEDEDGCPDPDNDKDQIPDVVDKCPNEPETYNGFEDEDGCPDKGSVIIQDNNIVILDKIKFRTNSAEILPESNKIVDAVATTINHHPEFELMEIAGHADERSSDQYNLRLTQDRVNSVLAALVQRGVARDKLRSKGYGEYCPEDTGHNEAAWEKNRRVEFKIVKTKDGPTGVELGCPNATAHGVPPDPIK
ncbi:MAG: OmpA family protein [Polyangiaceae bacterium]|jgi:OmpA-OmpF porin, OOP family